jgi:hypothetical protein
MPKYKYNTYCQECLKKGINENALVDYWTYETINESPYEVKFITFYICDKGHKWEEEIHITYDDLPLPVKLEKKEYTIFLNRDNRIKRG